MKEAAGLVEQHAAVDASAGHSVPFRCLSLAHLHAILSAVVAMYQAQLEVWHPVSFCAKQPCVPCE